MIDLICLRLEQTLVHEGQALFHISSFEKLNLVAEQLGNLQEAYNLADDDLIF